MERNKIIYGGQTLIDLTDATATASDILSGKTAYGADGSLLIGTNTNSEWTSGIYMDEDGYIRVSPLAGAGGVVFEDGYLIFSPNAGEVQVVTTPTYMWKDSENFVHFSTTEHNGYQINVASVEEHHIWVTVFETSIASTAWVDGGNYLDTAINADWSSLYDMDPSQILFRVTYDGVPYTMILAEADEVGSYLGSNVYRWDGESALEYPFGIYPSSGETYIDIVDKTPNVTHTFKVEYEE